MRPTDDHALLDREIRRLAALTRVYWPIGEMADNPGRMPVPGSSPGF